VSQWDPATAVGASVSVGAAGAAGARCRAQAQARAPRSPRPAWSPAGRAGSARSPSSPRSPSPGSPRRRPSSPSPTPSPRGRAARTSPGAPRSRRPARAPLAASEAEDISKKAAQEEKRGPWLDEKRRLSSEVAVAEAEFDGTSRAAAVIQAVQRGRMARRVADSLRQFRLQVQTTLAMSKPKPKVRLHLRAGTRTGDDLGMVVEAGNEQNEQRMHGDEKAHRPLPGGGAGGNPKANVKDAARSSWKKATSQILMIQPIAKGATVDLMAARQNHRPKLQDALPKGGLGPAADPLRCSRLGTSRLGWDGADGVLSVLGVQQIRAASMRQRRRFGHVRVNTLRGTVLGPGQKIGIRTGMIFLPGVFERRSDRQPARRKPGSSTSSGLEFAARRFGKGGSEDRPLALDMSCLRRSWVLLARSSRGRLQHPARFRLVRCPFHMVCEMPLVVRRRDLHRELGVDEASGVAQSLPHRIPRPRLAPRRSAVSQGRYAPFVAPCGSSRATSTLSLVMTWFVGHVWCTKRSGRWTMATRTGKRMQRRRKKKACETQCRWRHGCSRGMQEPRARLRELSHEVGPRMSVSLSSPAGDTSHVTSPVEHTVSRCERGLSTLFVDSCDVRVRSIG
ncbi:unnamed protein product, partial [Prorocentrum cordatum]